MPKLFAKRGLWIRTGSRVELTVATGAAVGLAIEWGNIVDPNPQGVTVDCPVHGRPGWLNFPGGYWVDHPACVSLSVHAHGRTRRVRLGVGVACPGQKAPID